MGFNNVQLSKVSWPEPKNIMSEPSAATALGIGSLWRVLNKQQSASRRRYLFIYVFNLQVLLLDCVSLSSWKPQTYASCRR